MQAKEKVQVLDCRGIGFDILKGKTLKSRFKVQKLLDQGSFGKIYEVIDSKSTDQEGNTQNLRRQRNDKSRNTNTYEA